MTSSAKAISIGAAATLACLYEATARKPGNVYPGADFDAMTTYAAFVKSAIVIGPIIEQAPLQSVGRTVLAAVRATRDAVGTNTNLGTLLLIAPLAAAPLTTKVADGIAVVLDALTPDDTRHVYEAIRLANAGGLGCEVVADVHDAPPPDLTLKEAMRLAAERDLIAKQYGNQFEDVANLAEWISESLSDGMGLNDAIVDAYVSQLSGQPDSLIQRKCGTIVGEEATRRAADVMNSGPWECDWRQEALRKFDNWLRADGNRRNPGTTADLIAASLFVLLREGRLNWNEW